MSTQALIAMPFSRVQPRRLTMFAVLPTVIFVLLVLVPLAHLALDGRRGLSSEAQFPTSSAGGGAPLTAHLVELDREHQFLQARLTMANDGDIGLSIDLADSVAIIELAGVPLRHSRIVDMDVSRLLAHRLHVDPASALYTLARGAATIPKVPIQVVDAPRDTVEAQSRPPQEIPLETRLPFVVLHFAEGLTLWMRPEHSTPVGSLLGSMLTVRTQLDQAAHMIGQLARGEAAVPVPWIEIELAAEDVRAVYRALPPDGQLALRLPAERSAAIYETALGRASR